MALGEAVIAAGIGCRKGASGEAVLAAVDAALAVHGLSRRQLHLLATAAGKEAEAGIVGAAQALGLPVHAPSQASLRQAEARLLTRSAASLRARGVASVSEAAALAALGPASRLLGPRVALGPATCAVAAAEDAP